MDRGVWVEREIWLMIGEMRDGERIFLEIFLEMWSEQSVYVHGIHVMANGVPIILFSRFWSKYIRGRILMQFTIIFGFYTPHPVRKG